MNELKLIALVAICSVSSVTFAQNNTKTTVQEVMTQTTKATDALQNIGTDSIKSWKFSGTFGANSAITGLWNWAAGGTNSASFIAFANLRVIYKKKKWAWESTYDTDFGYTYLDVPAFPWRKSNDKLIFNTKAGYDLKHKFYLTLLCSFRSQYTKGYDYTNDVETYISNYLSPSYTDISLGIDWKPNDIFSVYFSPAAGRITTCIDTTKQLKAMYGIDTLKNYKIEFGSTLKGQINYTYKNFKFTSALTLFTPYSKHFGNIDIDWDLAVGYQFMKMLNVSLGSSLKYYDAIKFDNGDGITRQHMQFKSVLGIGIGYTF
jgi:hypothetical protein